MRGTRQILCFYAFAACALWPWVSAAQLSNDPDFAHGQEEWVREHWQPAATHLSKFVAAGSDRATYTVAYWLGTSWCRIEGKENAGADALGWGLSFRQVPEDERPKFASELRLCLQWLNDATQARSTPAGIVADDRRSNATATVRVGAKTYHLVEVNRGLSAYPVRAKRAMENEEFEKRLVRRSDANAGAGAEAAGKQMPGASTHQGKYVVIASLSGHDPAALTRIADELDAYVEFLMTDYGLAPPDWYMTVYLVPNNTELQKWADKLHGLDASEATLGYALENDQSVVSKVEREEGVGTVRHELFHLMVRHSYASAPQWLEEGFASLYETSTRREQRFCGEPNWRSRVFQEMRGPFSAQITLRRVITSPWFSDEPAPAAVSAALPQATHDPDEQAYMLAYARLFALYLQEHGQLRTVFNAFRTRVPPAKYEPAEDQAVALLQKAMSDKPWDSIERDFLAWVPNFYDPNRRLYSGPSAKKDCPQAQTP